MVGNLAAAEPDDLLSTAVMVLLRQRVVEGTKSRFCFFMRIENKNVVFYRMWEIGTCGVTLSLAVAGAYQTRHGMNLFALACIGLHDASWPN